MREIAFTGDQTAMVAARDIIMQCVRDGGVDEPDEIDIFLALQEALANAVLHGCQGDPSKVIRCTVEVNTQAISITVRDPGAGFDLVAVEDPVLQEPNLSDHGRGIQLMRALMDEVSYSHGGSELRLTKLRHRA